MVSVAAERKAWLMKFPEHAEQSESKSGKLRDLDLPPAAQQPRKCADAADFPPSAEQQNSKSANLSDLPPPHRSSTEWISPPDEFIRRADRQQRGSSALVDKPVRPGRLEAPRDPVRVSCAPYAAAGTALHACFADAR